MKKYLIFLGFLFSLHSCNNQSVKSKKYVVNKVTTSCSCTVQLTDASPIGQKHLGPFTTKDSATKAMCKDIDITMTDQTHCWVTVPQNACQ